MYCFLLVLHTLCLLNLVFQDLLMKLLNGMTMFISITDILQILLKVSRSLSTIQRKYHFLHHVHLYNEDCSTCFRIPTLVLVNLKSLNIFSWECFTPIIMKR